MHTLLILALVVAAAAAYADWRTGRVPNFLTVTALVGAPLAHLFWAVDADGWTKEVWRAPLDSLLGTLVCGAVPLLLFLKHAIGGGDVKLLAALGGFLGMRLGLQTEFCIFAFASLVGPARLAYEGRLFSSIKTALLVAVRPGRTDEKTKMLVSDLTGRFALGPAILAGTALTAWLHWRPV